MKYLWKNLVISLWQKEMCVLSESFFQQIQRVCEQRVKGEES